MGPLDLANYVQQQGQMGRERGTNTRLNQLAGQAYGANPQDQRGIVQQAIQTDRGQGMALGNSLNADRDAGTKRLAQKAGMVAKIYRANPQMAAGMYSGLAQEASQFFPDMQFEPQLDDATAGLLEQFAGAYGSPQDGLPSGLREFNAMTEGMSPEDNLKARRVALGLDGRASTSGFSQVKFTDAQGRERVGSFNGRTGSIDLPDGTSFNPQTGQTSQTQPETGMQQGQQRAPGEVPFSIDPSLPPQVQAAIRANEPQWAQASDQSQMQIPQQGGQPQPQQGGDPFTSRSAEEQAALTTGAQEQAKINAEMGSYRDMTGLEAERAATVERAKLGVQRESDKAEAAPKARMRLQQVSNKAENLNRALDQAVPNVNVWTAGLAGVPLSKLPGAAAADLRANLDTVEAIIAFDELQQMRASSPTGGALGSVTERELALLASTITNIKQAQSPEQLRSNLAFLKVQYNKVLRQMQSDYQADYGGGQQPGSATDAPRRTNVTRIKL